MTARRTWQEVEQVFLESIEVEPHARPAFLDRRCAGDESLRTSVEELLGGHDAAEPKFIAPVEVAPRQPLQIGRYRVTRLIASGGMGAVYEAEQDSPRRAVAVKVLRAGVGSPTLARRFAQESEVLARLRHPGIAQVYEAGTFDDGSGPVPFFAMELIESARPITEVARSLSIPAVLDLFLQVCDAVHHGHQRGVIHRDLKPGNILIDHAGKPKIIDFGIARAAGAAADSMHTSAGQMIGTLAYMSPEQCAGDPAALDIRTDVYSLGAVLYEVLCGQTPFNPGDKPLLEAARAIREDAPPRPGALVKSLRGDLETIILTAIERDRARRYQSVAELAADISRLRNHQTIAARPAGAAHQLRLFARRNRALAVGASVALAGLVFGSAGAVWQAVRATDEAHRAKRAETSALDEADTATRIAKCLQDAIASIDPRITADDGLTRAAILHASADSIVRELKDKPLAQAYLLERLGDAYQSLGLTDRSGEMYRSALKLLSDHDAPFPDRARVTAALSTTCRVRGDWDQGERLCRSVLSAPANADVLISRVVAGRNLTLTLLRRRETVEAQLVAQTTLRDSLALNLPGGNSVFDARLGLAAVLEAAGNPAAARAQLNDATAGASNRSMSAYGLFELGVFESRHNRPDAAAEAFATAIAAWRSASQSRDRDTAYLCIRIANLLEANARWEFAETFFLEAIARQTELYGPRHITVGDLSMHLANTLQSMNRPADAAPLYQEAASILRAAVGDEHPDVGSCLYQQARIAAALRDEPTLRHLQVEAAILERANLKLPANHPHRSGLLLLTGFVEMNLGRPAAAETSLRECVRLRTEQLGSHNRITLYAQTVLGGCLALQGRFEEAETVLQEFVPQVEASYIPGSYMSAEARQRLVDLYTAWGKPELAAAARMAGPSSR